MARKKYSLFHQIMAAVLCVALLGPIVAPLVNEVDDTAAAATRAAPTVNQVLTTVFAASDFQPKVSGSDPAVPDVAAGKATTIPRAIWQPTAIWIPPVPSPRPPRLLWRAICPTR